jgi:hypothetical protein
MPCVTGKFYESPSYRQDLPAKSLVAWHPKISFRLTRRGVARPSSPTVSRRRARPLALELGASQRTVQRVQNKRPTIRPSHRTRFIQS